MIDRGKTIKSIFKLVQNHIRGIASPPPPPPPPLNKGGVEDFGSSEIGGGLALISGFWGDLEKRGIKIIQGGGVESLGSLTSLSWIY